MAKINQPSNLIDRIKNLEREVAELRKRTGLGNAQVSSGNFTLKGGQFRVLQEDGTGVVFMGPVILGDNTSNGWLFSRHTGEVAIGIQGTPDGQYVGIFDEQGNTVFSDDAESGQGLATPYIPLTGTPTRLLFEPGESATLASFEPMWTIQGTKQHPRVAMGLLVDGRSSGGGTDTAGEWRVTDPNNGGVVLSGPHSITSGSYGYQNQVFAVSGAHLDTLQLDIEVRRTSGTSPLRTQLAYAQGQQS